MLNAENYGRETNWKSLSIDTNVEDPIIFGMYLRALFFHREPSQIKYSSRTKHNLIKKQELPSIEARR
jgi:hypothetical protein